MVKKLTATSKHPCPFCMTSSPNFKKTDHCILESLCRLYDKWMADGAKFKKGNKVYKCYSSLLLTGDKNKNILEHVNILCLHILLGAVGKILKDIEKCFFEKKKCGL